MTRLRAYLNALLKPVSLGLRAGIIAGSIFTGAVISSLAAALAFVGTFTILAMVSCFFCAETYHLVALKNAHGNDDTQNYLVDFAPLLGPEWEAGIIRIEKNGDIVSTDTFDYVRSVIGRSSYVTSRKINHLAYFREYVFKFTSRAEADKRFDKEREWIFVYEYGVPISRQEYPFVDLDLPADVVFRADEYEVACNLEPTATRCNGLLRYKQYVVFIDVFLIRDSIRYLSEDDFIEVLKLIDDKMISVRTATPTPD